MKRSVIIIGGGIAGLSSAVFLTESGFKVTLIESSPKLGGRAYSFFDRKKNQFFDNGQHILAGWYKNTFEYLKIIGNYDKLNFQNGLEVNFINLNREVFQFKCPDTKPPLNLLIGLLKFKAFGLKDKFALKNIKKLFKLNDFESKYGNVRDLLEGINQTENIIKYFWEPFIFSVFNTRPENVSVKIFLNVMKEGFKSKNNSMLVIPSVNLNELFINDAVDYLKMNDADIFLNQRVKRINLKAGSESDNKSDLKIENIMLEDNTNLKSEIYISAVGFYDYKELFGSEGLTDDHYNSDRLKTSSIVSVHLFFNGKIPEELIPHNSFGMTGLIGTKVQWIFKRSDQHLSLVISGADEINITGMSNEEIFKLCINELMQTLDGFERLEISDYKVIKEKRATFIPDDESNEFRPPQSTNINNFFIAGDWTDTGFPSTIEGAVTSSKHIQSLLTGSNVN
ncbi:MAG: hydroxysqualene dehydroxylase HpnE [Ignavibacteria bacterium]